MKLIGCGRHRPNANHQMIRIWNIARQLRIAFPGAFYHVTARGNERKAVFKSIRDRQKFLEYLETATERYNAVIHAYA
jgi:REP element-mobilizing transposase RayT